MRHKLDRQELQYKAISKTDISYYVERNTLEHERFIILSAHLWCWECQTGFKTKKTMSVQDPLTFWKSQGRVDSVIFILVLVPC